MTQYEYKVIPAPTKGAKAPGVKAAEARFAGTIEATLNTQAADGWQYLRTDILPSDERQGLTGSQTVYRTLMVFQRVKSAEGDPADKVIQSAQDVAEAVTPEASGPGTSGQKGVQRREPSLTPIKPSRADPAPSPDAPKPEPDAPKPDTPKTPDKD